MKYDHIVKRFGIYYQAGQDVPDINETAMDESLLPFSDSEIEFETKKQKSYTKTDINKMTTAELKELAFDNGFENAEEMTGTELKKILIQYFGL